MLPWACIPLLKPFKVGPKHTHSPAGISDDGGAKSPHDFALKLLSTAFVKVGVTWEKTSALNC